MDKKKMDFGEKFVSVRSDGSGEMATKMGLAEALWWGGGGAEMGWW
jgi:hypothetical protein